MKIRTQNLLAIVPLFLGLAVLIGALFYVVQYRELLWGLDEEATSIAVATARHLESESWLEDETDVDWEDLMAESMKVLEWERARRIAILSPDLRVLFDSAEDEGDARPIGLSPTLHSRLSDRGFVGSSIRQDERGRYMMGFGSIRDEEDIIAIVMVETDAEALTAHENRMRRDILFIVIGTVLIGFVLALTISRIISRRIVSLTRAASAVAAGRYDQPHEVGGVQEINDLSSTFNTMSSILSEVVSKTRRAVVEAEQFRTDDDLARAFTETFMPSEQRRVHGVDLSAMHVTSRSGGHFFGVWEKGDAVMAVVGEVSAGAGLSAPLTASACASMLQEHWKQKDLKAACAEWSRLFDLRAASVLSWPAGAAQLTHGVWDTKKQSFVYQTTPWPAAPVVVHTVSERVAHRIKLYVETFGHLAPAELTQEIALTLDKEQQGAVILAKSA